MSQLTIVGSGDAIVARRTPTDPDGHHGDLIRLLRSADVAFTNVEIPLSGFVGRKGDWFAISADPEIAHDLRAWGFGLVSFANNHTMNYGEPGMHVALEALGRAGIAVAGAGRNLHEARRPAYVDVPAGRVALVAATSTFEAGEQATHQTRGELGRGGINPLRHEATFVVDDPALAELRRIGEMTRLGGRRRGLRHRPTLAAPRACSMTERYEFGGRLFAAGTRPGHVNSELDAEDVTGITQWVREARQYADIVIVSIHCHEAGVESPDKVTPPEFLEDFARASIDAGADVVFGHGPHRLGGLELYHGRPIFYSLGNLFWQVEFVTALLGEHYVGPEMLDWTPFEFHSRFVREQDIRDDPDQWDTLLPECRFENERLTGIVLHPAVLGWGEPLPRRGSPRLAHDEDARRILTAFAELSAVYGTVVDIEGDVASVRLTDA